MAEPYIGEIRLVGFNFAPIGWNFCNGATLPITEYIALFNLIGTTYGGDGQQTFRLPDLQGRVPVHMGSSQYGSYLIGEEGGTENVTLITSQIPSHGHSLNATGSLGNTSNPSGHLLAQAPLAMGNVYGNGTTTQNSNITTAATGGSQPHNNMQPFLTMNYIISLFGVYPSQG